MVYDEDAILRALLPKYDISTIEQIASAGGTAGKTWRLTAGGVEYLLRLRGVRTSTRAHLEFDHGLRAHLVDRGVPTARAVSTQKGKRWVRWHGRVYELYPFIAGRPFNPHRLQELVRAAQALAAFHRAAQDYQPPDLWDQTVAQYTSLGFSDRVSDRLDDPSLQLVNLQGIRGLAKTSGQVQLVDRCIARVQALQHTYAGPAYDTLTGYVIHGDYTPANIVYSPQGEVAGIFDFDWAMYGARCLDVAYGLCFFATEPRPLDSSSIWSLTAAADLTVERCATFLSAYHAAWPLTRSEIETVPHAFCSLWLSKRLEGTAKVEKDRRFHFFAREIEKPLRWMDTHWKSLCRAAFGLETSQ